MDLFSIGPGEQNPVKYEIQYNKLSARKLIENVACKTSAILSRTLCDIQQKLIVIKAAITNYRYGTLWDIITYPCDLVITLRWRHNGPDSASNYQPHECLLSRLFRRRSKKTSKLRVTGLCAGNSPGTGELPAQMASNAENVFTWWRHHDAVEVRASPYRHIAYCHANTVSYQWSNHIVGLSNLC